MNELIKMLLNYLKSSESPYSMLATYLLSIEAYAYVQYGSITGMNLDEWILSGVLGLIVLLYTNHLEKKLPKHVVDEVEKWKLAAKHYRSEAIKLKEGKS